MRHQQKELKVESRKLKVLRVAPLVAFAFSLSFVSAQESVNATGGNASGSGGLVSYSVGQIVHQTHTGTNGSVSEGVQQPFEISVATVIEEIKGINLTVTAYPNPATDYLKLKVESKKLKGLSYQLFDIQGNLLQTKKLTDTETQIDMNSYVPSSYFLKVMNQNLSIKEFKIIKN